MAESLKLRRMVHPAGPQPYCEFTRVASPVGFQGLYATAAPSLLAEPARIARAVPCRSWRIELHRTMGAMGSGNGTAPPACPMPQRRNIAGAAPLRHILGVTWISRCSCGGLF